MSNIKTNDWIAVNLNAPENMTIDALPLYDITAENTGIQSEDYYKTKKQVLNSELFKNNDGTFNQEKFHDFYESALRSFNEFQNVNFTKDLIENIEHTSYDVFSPFTGPKFNESAYLYESQDPRRTTHGLGNIYETGAPVFDEREVAQANKMRDEDGTVLDWTPNEKGGLLKGLFRPAAAMAIYENDEYDENGKLLHRKGDYILDENGDPFYQLIGNKSIAGRETLKYWDTLTDDDSPWNKVDFMDSDGLTKSFGGILTRTAVTLLPYFIPGVGEVMGYVGASIALGEALPVLGKALDSIITGSTNNDFGKTMYSIGNWFDRFNRSQSRDSKGKFFSFENIGDIISSSAGQLFQQRNVANLARTIFYQNDPKEAAKLGRYLSFGYMAVTSGQEAYDHFKEAGASDGVAGIATLATMGAYYGLFNIDYFKQFLFTNTFMDEDIAMTDTIKKIVEANTVKAYKDFSENYAKKNLSELGKRLERIKLYTSIRDGIKTELSKLAEARPTIKQTLETVNEETKKKGISFTQRLGMYLTRATNEGFEETMEEVMQDITKGITLGLNELGVNVSEEGKTLDFGLTIQDMASRYLQSFVGGFIGGAVFEGFNHWEGGPYTSLLEKDLEERLVWYYRNGYGDEIENRLDRLYKKGKLGNTELSATPLRTKSVEGNDNLIVFGQSKGGDSQNDAVYNVIKTYLNVIKRGIDNNGLFTDDNKIFQEIYKNIIGNSDYDEEEDPASKLYHFLKDVDTAKAKTIQQMGFLKLVSADVTKYAKDILEKDKEIEKEKDTIRKENRLTDASSNRENELFSKSEILKRLEEEKKELKEKYESIIKGESAGWYMGLAHMQANPKYITYYESPEFIKDQTLDGFPKTELENFVKSRTGLNYNSITDKKLKEKLESDFDAYKKLNGIDKLRAIYEMHVQLGQRFAPDIISQNSEFLGWIQTNSLQFIRNFISDRAKESEDIVLQNAINTFEERIKEIEKIENLDEKMKAIDIAGNILTLSVFSNPRMVSLANPDGTFKEELIATDVDIARGLLFLKDLAKAVIDTKAIVDLNPIRKFIVSYLFNANDRLLNEKIEQIENERNPDRPKNEIIIPLNFYLDENLWMYDESEVSNLDKDQAIQWLEEKFPSNVVEKLLESIRKKRGDDFDGSDVGEEVSEYFLLLSPGRSERKFLQDQIDGLKKAIINNDVNIEDKFNAIINYITDNSPLDKEKAISIVNAIINPIGYDWIQSTKEYQKILEQQKLDPVLNILRKYNISQGGQIFNIIELIESEEAFRNQNEEEYKFTKPEVRKQLDVALSYLGVVTAIIESTFDGMNEEINTSEDLKLAVSDDSLKSIYLTGLNTLLKRIYDLIELAEKNTEKTTRAQQETDINTRKQRVLTLTQIGEIDFDNTLKIDLAKIWTDIGYSISDASIDKAVQFSDAYDKFAKEVSKQLRVIFDDYKAKKKINDFIDVFIDKFGEDIYLQNPGEVSPKPEITPYGNVNWLFSLIVLDPDEGNSLWKTVGEANQQLIPLFGQENAAKEALAHAIDTFEEIYLFDTFHQRLKDRFPKSKIYPTHEKFVDSMEVAKRFENIDGLGGVGKTQAVAYLVQEMLRLKYDSTLSFAVSKTEEATFGLQQALNQKGVLPIKGLTFEKLVSELTDNGQLFNLSEAKQMVGNGVEAFRNMDNSGHSFENIPVDRIKQILGNEKTIIFLDESGLLNRVQIGFLLKLAEVSNSFVIGSGDVYQNQAKDNNSKSTSGIEDYFYHKIAPLTVSMRAEYNGQYINSNSAKEILKNVKNAVLVKFGASLTEYDKATKKELLERPSKLEFFYANSNFAGTQTIKGEFVEQTVSKMDKLINELKEKDPDKKHKIAILVGDDSRKNKYDSIYENNDNVEVIHADKVQGREFDYVIIDKAFDTESLYLSFKDFYTMLTRAKIGSVFVDDPGFISSTFGILFTPNESAAAPMMGGSAEEKRKIFELYIKWKNEMMAKYPLYSKATTQTNPEPPVVQPGANTGGNNGSNGQEQARKFEVFGVQDQTEKQNLEELRKDKDKRNQHYMDQMTDNTYEGRQLSARNEALAGKNPQLIDFDVFIEELKNINDPIFESLPGCIFIDKGDAKARLNYRALIATIARGILSTKSGEERIKYFLDAGPTIKAFASGAFLSDSFTTSLQESFGNSSNSTLLAYGNYMYYGLTINGNDYLFPIYKLQNPTNTITYYSKNTDFSTVVSDIPISTNGEMRFDVNEIFNEIDGLLRVSGSKEVQLVVSTPNKALSDILYSDRETNRNDSAGRMIDYMGRDRGKSFIAFTSSSPIWRTFANTFSILRKNGFITSLVNKEYDNDVSQPFNYIGLQKDITFQKWISIIAPLLKLVNSKEEVKRVLNSQEQQALTDWFGENVLKEFDSTTSGHRENNSIRYAKLKDYRVLHIQSIESFTSALIRYIQTLPIDNPLRSRFNQNFTGWFNVTPSEKSENQEERTHYRGFIVRIVTKSTSGGKEFHNFRILPKINGGYTIDYIGPLNKLLVTRLTESEDKIQSLFKNLDYDFLSVISSILTSIRSFKVNDASLDSLISSVITKDGIDEKAFKSGSLQLFPIDTYVENNDKVIAYHPPFETEIYRWLAQTQDKSYVPIEDVDKLDKFLREDSEFKYGLFAAINAVHNSTEKSESEPNAWSESLEIVLGRPGIYSVDITKVIAPLFKSNLSEYQIVDTDDKFQELSSRFEKLIETKEDLNNIKPAVSINQASMIFDSGKLLFTEFTVNKPWLDKYIPDAEIEPSDVYNIQSINLLNRTFTINNEQIVLEMSQLKQIVDSIGGDLQQYFNSIIQLDKARIAGDTIAITDSTSTKTSKFNLLGYNSNTNEVLLNVGNGDWKIYKVTPEQLEQLISYFPESANNDNFITFYQDELNQKTAIYSNDGRFFITSHEPGVVLTEVNRSAISAYLPKQNIKTEMDISNIKQYSGDKTTIFIGTSVVPADIIRSWTDTEIENGNYSLLGKSGNLLYLYRGTIDNVTVVKLVNNDFNNKLDKESSGKVNIDEILLNLGIERDVVSELVNNKAKTPVDFINYIISEYNKKQSDKYNNDLESTEPLKQLYFSTTFGIKESINTTVEFKRLVYKDLKEAFGNINDLVWIYNGINNSTISVQFNVNGISVQRTYGLSEGKAVLITNPQNGSTNIIKTQRETLFNEVTELRDRQNNSNDEEYNKLDSEIKVRAIKIGLLDEIEEYLDKRRKGIKSNQVYENGLIDQITDVFENSDELLDYFLKELDKCNS